MTYFPPLFILFVFFAMLINPSLCIQAAGEGLRLWYSQVLPALFPSMILTSLIIRSSLITCLLSKIHILRRLPTAHILPLLSGILCGYPIGAKTCRDLYASGALTQNDIKRMNCFVHTPSPMFMLGYVSTICLPSVNPAKLLLSVYLPIPALIFLSYRLLPADPAPSRQNFSSKLTFSMDLFDDVYNKSVQILIKIAGYLMLFTIINRLLLHLFPQASLFLIPLSGILEMTYGIRFTSDQSLPFLIRETLTAFFLGFGGFSTMLQVRDALPKDMFYPKSYLSFRILHGILAAACYYVLRSV